MSSLCAPASVPAAGRLHEVVVHLVHVLPVVAGRRRSRAVGLQLVIDIEGLRQYLSKVNKVRARDERLF